MQTKSMMALVLASFLAIGIAPTAAADHACEGTPPSAGACATWAGEEVRETVDNADVDVQFVIDTVNNAKDTVIGELPGLIATVLDTAARAVDIAFGAVDTVQGEVEEAEGTLENFSCHQLDRCDGLIPL